MEGEGLRTVELSLKDLQTRFKKHTITATLQCTGNRRDDLNTVKPVKGLEWSVGAPATRASSHCFYAIKADWACIHGSYDNYVCLPPGAVLVILVAFCCQVAAWTVLLWDAGWLSTHENTTPTCALGCLLTPYLVMRSPHAYGLCRRDRHCRICWRTAV